MATNSQYSVVTADCLVSIGANPYDALVVKTAAVWYKDARLALGFSGLAGLNLQRGQRGPVSDPGSFRTMWWLLDGILGTSKPDYMMQNSLARLAQYMATTFPPAGTPPSLMALELGFAGSWSTNLGIKQVVGKITNLDRTVSTGISRDFTVKLAIRDDPALGHVDSRMQLTSTRTSGCSSWSKKGAQLVRSRTKASTSSATPPGRNRATGGSVRSARAS